MSGRDGLRDLRSRAELHRRRRARELRTRPRRAAGGAALRPCRSGLHRPAARAAALSRPISPISAPMPPTGRRRSTPVPRAGARSARAALRHRPARNIPQDFPWTDNIFFVRHLPPAEHPAFYASSRLTLNVTRDDMAAMGWCPSGRLFEAAACGAHRQRRWDGLDDSSRRGGDPRRATPPDDALAALDLSDAELAPDRRGGARQRVLAEHTSAHRAPNSSRSRDRCRAAPAAPLRQET